MRFLVDAQLPLLLADWLRDQGHGADRNPALLRQLEAAWPRIIAALEGDGLVVEAR